jgi:GNAT superfamily N-acetyltransferase
MPEVTIKKARRLKSNSSLKPFDCGYDDLNEFFFNDAVPHSNELLSVTYIFETSKTTIAYVSLLNDRISREALDKKVQKEIGKGIPYAKRGYKSYPAVKIGRLGVHVKYKRKGIGTKIINAIKTSFTAGNKTGCRFITVDARNSEEALSFYLKNGFNFLLTTDKDDEHRLMYFDLMRFIR